MPEPAANAEPMPPAPPPGATAPARPSPEPSSSAPAPYRAPRELLAAGVCAIMLALLAAGAIAWRRSARPSPEPQPIARPPESPPPLPASMFELRGVWVAVVDNIDWPSAKSLGVAAQRAEMRALLDAAARVNINTVILQVRNSCDAIYPSTLEPWSEYLTGKQGLAPNPAYDPLQAWIDETHARGMELHAWFNPFRARHFKAEHDDAPNHISKTRPDIVRAYGTPTSRYLWLDPGEPDARELALAIVRDVVSRYDVDGVHIDDYFYPYTQANLEFPDDTPWSKYKAGGGTLSRANWRRANIDAFVQRFYADIKSLKPGVKVGISPFGIWRPGFPAGVQGMDSYEKLFADSRRWLREGWADYFTPQLYWPLASKEQPFGALLDWWIGENAAGRVIAPGLNTSRITPPHPRHPEDIPKSPYAAREILDQIDATRARTGAAGTIQFSAIALSENREGIADALAAGPFAHPALPPPMPWLPGVAPAAPVIELARGADSLVVRWAPGSPDQAPSRWVLALRLGEAWSTRVLPARVTEFQVPAESRDLVTGAAVLAVDRPGRASRWAPAAVQPPR